MRAEFFLVTLPSVARKTDTHTANRFKRNTFFNCGCYNQLCYALRGFFKPKKKKFRSIMNRAFHNRSAFSISNTNARMCAAAVNSYKICFCLHQISSPVFSGIFGSTITTSSRVTATEPGFAPRGLWIYFRWVYATGTYLLFFALL